MDRASKFEKLITADDEFQYLRGEKSELDTDLELAIIKAGAYSLNEVVEHHVDKLVGLIDINPELATTFVEGVVMDVGQVTSQAAERVNKTDLNAESSAYVNKAVFSWYFDMVNT